MCRVWSTVLGVRVLPSRIFSSRNFYCRWGDNRFLNLPFWKCVFHLLFILKQISQ